MRTPGPREPRVTSTLGAWQALGRMRQHVPCAGMRSEYLWGRCSARHRGHPLPLTLLIPSPALELGHHSQAEGLRERFEPRQDLMISNFF